MKRLIGALILTLAMVAARQAGAAEANCYMGNHGSDAGPCSGAERDLVDLALALIEPNGTVDQSVPMGSAVVGAVATLHEHNRICGKVSYMTLVNSSVLVMSCDHKTHIYSLIYRGAGEVEILDHRPQSSS